jgi:hypothetical protein
LTDFGLVLTQIEDAMKTVGSNLNADPNLMQEFLDGMDRYVEIVPEAALTA